MESIYPDEGLLNGLGKIIRPSAQIGLYTNAIALDQSTTFAMLTEAAFAGYARANLIPATWNLALAGHVGTGVYPVQIFTNTSGGSVTVQGYFILDDLGFLFQVTEFDGAPITILAGGSALVIPVVGDFSSSL